MRGKSLAKIEWMLRGKGPGRARRALQSGATVALAAAAALLFGSQRMRASEPTIAGGPMIQRSMRVIPRRYVITPSGATVPANQTQKFDVVDTNGNPVAVRWNLSGLGCYGATCGSIDEQGVYHPPTTLPKPSIVTLEGVVVSDPHFSVLTQIRLQEAKNAASPESAAAAPVKAELVASGAPASSKSSSMAATQAIPATPNVMGAEVVRAPAGVPLPAAVAAAPTVIVERAPRASELPGAPVVVAAAPKVAAIESARGGNLMPLPAVVASAPQVAPAKVGDRPSAMPLPAVKSPASAGSGVSKESRGKEMPLVLAIGGTPSAGSQKEMRSKDVLATPAGGSAQSPASPSAAQHTQPPVPVAAATPVAASSNAAPPLLAHVVTPEPLPSSAPLSPPSEAPKGTVELSPQQVLVRVTYRSGLLTIEARNATLAEVLKAVAAKTGATIDVPPGTGQEVIVEHAGPGKPNDVMTQLLNGSHFNFILVNSPERPDELAQILLSVQPADSGAVVAQAPPTPAAVPNPSTPPATTAAVQPRPLDYDLTTVPADLSRDAMGDFMKERFRQILERQKQEAPQQPGPPQQ